MSLAVYASETNQLLIMQSTRGPNVLCDLGIWLQEIAGIMEFLLTRLSD